MLQARNEWDDKAKRKKKLSTKKTLNISVKKIHKKSKKKKKKKKLKVFITTRHVLQERLKRVIKVETIGHWTETQRHKSIKLADIGKYIDESRIPHNVEVVHKPPLPLV